MSSATRLLILGLEGASPAAWETWSSRGCLPFLAQRLARVGPRGLSPIPGGGRRSAWRALLHGPSGLWTRLRGAGVPLGALGFPDPAPVGPDGFSFSVSGSVARPTDLAADLADYQDESGLALSGGPALRRPADLDLLAAELSALARLQREHALRLAASRRPAVLALNFAGFRHALAAFWDLPDRLGLLLGQYDANLRALCMGLNPAQVAVLSPYAMGPSPVAGENGDDSPSLAGAPDRVDPGLLLLSGQASHSQPALSPRAAALALAHAAGVEQDAP